MLKIMLLLFSFNVFATNYFPDKSVTTGSRCTAKDKEFRELRYEEDIPVCFRKVSSSTKKKIYRLYNIPSGKTKLYTIDHYIPLFMGGSNKMNNLWPQLRANSSSAFEQRMFYMLKNGRIIHTEALWFMKDRKDSK